MSLYPILWAVEHAPVRDAEERAILMALVVKGDFDGTNCFRSYPTLAKVARVSAKTAGRKCREMEQRGILRRQTEHLSQVWLRIPEAQQPVPWEVMIPASWYSRAQLAEINQQRESLGRPPITRQTRPDLADAPAKTARSDKGKKRPKQDDQDTDPGTDSPGGPGTDSPRPTGGNPGTISPHPPDSQSLPQGLSVPQPSETPSETPSEPAPSARSAADVRRTGAGSSARGSSGSAAPGPNPRLTREQRAAVQAVEASLPRPLLTQLPGGRIPGRNHRAVLAALDSRTPEQIAARIGRRWVEWDMEPAVQAGEIRSPVGAAMALIGPTPYCPDPSCEDGAMIDTDDECRSCVERRAYRRAAYNRGEDPRRTSTAAPPRPECIDCGRPLVRGIPADGMCRRCRRSSRRTPAEAAAALRARWAAEDAARAELEALHAEAAHRRAQRAANAQTPAQTGPPPF